MYIDVKQVARRKRAILRSRPFNVQATTRLRFAYHMYGRHTDRLMVQVGRARIFLRRGNRGNKWITANLSLRRFSGRRVAITITAWKGNGNRGNIALDRLQLLRPGSTPR
eukprot:UN4675